MSWKMSFAIANEYWCWHQLRQLTSTSVFFRNWCQYSFGISIHSQYWCQHQILMSTSVNAKIAILVDGSRQTTRTCDTVPLFNNIQYACLASRCRSLCRPSRRDVLAYDKIIYDLWPAHFQHRGLCIWPYCLAELLVCFFMTSICFGPGLAFLHLNRVMEGRGNDLL